MKKIPWALSLSLILGAFLRLDHFKMAAFWCDEAISANTIINSHNISELWRKTYDMANNISFTLLLKLWSILFGDSESALRLLSVVFGLLSIIAIYRLSKSFFNQKTANWSAFLLASSAIAVFFSYQARPYSLIVFLSIISTQAFLKLIRDDYKNRQMLIYGLIMLFSLYSLPWFFFLLATHFFIILIYKKELIKKIIILYSTLLLLSLPLLAEMFLLIENGVNNYISTASLDTLKKTFFFFSEGMVIPYITIAILGAIILLFNKTKKHTPEEIKNIKIVSILFSLPLVLGFTVSLFAPMYDPGRHEILVLPFFIIIISFLAAQIKNKIIIIALLLSIAFAAIKTTIKEKNYIKNQITNEKEVAIFLTEVAKSGDIIIVHNFAQYSLNYYLPRLSDKSYTKVNFPFFLDGEKRKNAMTIANINFLNIFNKQAKEDLLNRFQKKKYQTTIANLFIGSENYISETIEKTENNKIWLVYDSQRESDQVILEKLNSELKLINSYHFIKSKNDNAKNKQQLPMFFDHINEYERIN